MEADELARICQAVESGETKIDENTGSHEKGRVMFCSGDRIEVELTDKRETWGREFCRDVTPG
jgi:hypothetical protein